MKRAVKAKPGKSRKPRPIHKGIIPASGPGSVRHDGWPKKERAT